MFSLQQFLTRFKRHCVGRRRAYGSQSSASRLCEQLEVRALLSATIQGQAWQDINTNGQFDGEEVRQNGVQIDLHALSGEVIQTTSTADVDLNNDGVIDANLERGIYQFETDGSGAYTVSPADVAHSALTTPLQQRTAEVQIGNSLQSSVLNRVRGTAYAVDRDGIVFEYHITSNAIVRQFEFGQTIADLALSPDGHSLAAVERNLRDDLITVHLVDLETGNIQAWQHDPSGDASGIWHVSWSADDQLILLLGALHRPDDHQIMTFDLESKQFEFNRSATYGSSLTTTANGQITVLSGLGNTEDEVALYSAAAGSWTPVSPDVASVRWNGVIASNDTATRFLIDPTSQQQLQVVDENFQPLFDLPSTFQPRGFRSHEDTLLGAVTNTGETVRLDATTGQRLSVDFVTETFGYSQSYQVNGEEFLFSSSARGFTRSDSSINQTSQKQIFVSTTDNTTTLVQDIGIAPIDFLLSPHPRTLSLMEDGPAQEITVQLNQQPTADVVITVSLSDPTEVESSHLAIIVTEENWRTPQTVHLQGASDDLVDFRVNSTVTFAIDQSQSAPEFLDVAAKIIPVATFDSDTAIRGRVSSNAHLPGVSVSDREYIDGITIDLLDEFNNVIATSVTQSFDLDNNGFIDPATEAGWYRFDLLPEGYYTVVQRDIGPAAQPTPLISGPTAVARFIDDTRNETGVIDPVQPYAYATTEAGQVARQDTRAISESLVIDVGERAQGLDISADSQWLYVGEGQSQADGFRIHRLNTATLQYDSIDLPVALDRGSVNELKLNPDGRLFASVVDTIGRQVIVAITDPAGNPTTQVIYQSDSPHSIIAFTADGHRMLLSKAANGAAALIFDLQTGQTVATAASEISPIAMNASGDRLFAQSFTRDALLLDGNFQVLHRFGQFNAGAAFLNDQNTLLLGNANTSRLQRIDLATYEVISAETIPLPNSGSPMHFQLNANEDDLLLVDRYTYFYRIDLAGSDAAVHTVNLEPSQILLNQDFTRTAPLISVSKPFEGIRIEEESTTEHRLQFRLSHAPTEDVHVTVRGTDPSELSVAEQTFVFTADNWQTDRVLTYLGVDDNLPDGHQQSLIQFTINTSLSDSRYTTAADRSVVVTTLDNENRLSGRIWLDADEDGIFDANEEGQNGRTVQLFDRDANVLDTVLTQSIDINQNGQIDAATETGWYVFNNAPEGDVFVRHLGVAEEAQTFPQNLQTDLFEEFNLRQHAYSAFTDIIYAPDTVTGQIHRYHVGLQQQLSSMERVGWPTSIDVSADGKSLWLGNLQVSGLDNVIRRLDLESGEFTTFIIDEESLQASTSELVAMANGQILFTSLGQERGRVLRQLDPETGVVSTLAELDSSVFLSRSADHQTAVAVNYFGNKTLHRYDSRTSRLSTVGRLPVEDQILSIALSNDSRFIAIETQAGETTIHNSALQTTLQLPGTAGDFVFHPADPILYVLDADGSHIQSFNVINGDSLARFELHRSVVREGRFSMNISDDGEHVFVESFWGFQVIDVDMSPSDTASALPVTVQNGGLIDTANFGLAPPQVTLSDDGVERSLDEGTTGKVGRIRLSEQPFSNVSLTAVHSDPSQLAVEDSTFVFTPDNWNRWQPLNVTAIADGVPDGNQSVSVTVQVDNAESDSAFHNLTSKTTTITVIDAELPGIALSSTNVEIKEGAQPSQFTVALLQPPSGNVRLVLSTDAQNLVTLQTTELLFTPANWDQAQPVLLQVAQNGIVDELRTSMIEISVDQDNTSTEYDTVASVSVDVEVINSNVVEINEWSHRSDGSTHISWEVVDQQYSGRPFELQIVELSGTPEIIYSDVFSTDNNRVTIPESYGNGTYRIWIRGTEADGAWSTWSNRTAVRNQRTAITTAEYAQSSDDLEVTWEAVPGAASYRVFVSNISSGQQAIVDTTVADNTISLQGIRQLGTLRIWVQVLTADGLRSDWSEFAELSQAPEGIQPFTYFGGNQPQFRWTSVPRSIGYELYLSNRNGAAVQHFKNLTDTSFSITEPLESGIYRWWVRGITESGRPSAWSEPYEVTLGDLTLLTQESIDSTGGVPVLRWHATPNAVQYDVTLIQQFGDQAVIQYTGITETELQSAPLEPGNYRVWVKAIDANGQGQWGPSVIYTVADSAVPSVLHDLVTDPVTINQDLHFEWSSTEDTAGFDFIIIGDNKNYLRTVESPTSQGAASHQLTFTLRLPGGSYQWAVRHHTADGQLGEWVYGNPFENDGRIPLDLPTTFEEGDPIQFSWPALNGATRYFIQIDNINTGEQRFVRQDDLTSAEFQSNADFPRARYRVWVRAILSSDQMAPWSIPDEFEVV
ncbi:MAG: hypothetical protein ABJZ55_23530 [Fuerstiella sp.]